MRLVASSALMVCLLLSPPGARGEPVPINGIAVIVNSVPITFQEIEKETAREEDLLRRQYRAQPQELRQRIEKLRASVLDLLVERLLILHEFETAGYRLPENVIEEHVKGTIREKYGDRVTLIKTLQSEDVTYEQFKKEVRENFIIHAMSMKHVGSEVLISPYKIENYYAQNLDKFKLEDQIKLRVIYLTNKPDRDAGATKTLAGEILSKIEGGAAFAEMASIYSDGSQRSQGGDWGWIDKTVPRVDLAEVAFALKAGERSGVVERPDGCYLMWVEESKPAHTKPLSEARAEIENTIKVQEQQRARKRWIERLKTKSFIRYFPAA